MFTTTDPNDWQLIHMLETDTCKFAATLLHRLGSPRTIDFFRIACLDRNYTSFGYGLRLSPKANQAAACAHDVTVVVLYGIISNRKKMYDVKNAFFLSGYFSTRDYLYYIYYGKDGSLLRFLGHLCRVVPSHFVSTGDLV